MQIDKNQILDFLRSQGDQGKADTADAQLPDQVDTDQPEHRNLLESLGINPMELAKQFLGGKGIPGIPGF